MSDYCIAVACIIGPPLFFWGGWVARERRYRREWREIKKTRHIDVSNIKLN